MPPAELRYKVAGIREEEHFDASGRQSAQDLARALAGVGRSLSDFPRVLEWGCGCGRILRQLPLDLDRQDVHGCDIDGEAIAWMRENAPQFNPIRNDGLPPLPYPGGRFDLILNHSVLSHLDEAYQDAWLAELRRVLSPGGVLVLTVHGQFAYEAWLSSAPTDTLESLREIRRSRKALDARGIYFLDSGGWAGHFPAYYQNTFHTAAYVFRRWTAYFDILAYLPRGSLGHQDMILLRHKQPAAPPRHLPGAAQRAAMMARRAVLQAKILAKALLRPELARRP